MKDRYKLLGIRMGITLIRQMSENYDPTTGKRVLHSDVICDVI